MRYEALRRIYENRNMATFKICIFEHQKRQDGKYPVSIRVGWKRKSAYIRTEYYVTDKQVVKKKYLDKKGEKKESLSLKDIFISNELNKRIVKYEDLKAKKLGFKIELYTAKELAEWFQKEIRPGTDTTIDFIEFAREQIEKMKAQGRETSASNLNRSINAMIDFCNGREKISITEITSKFLEKFEAYLLTKRTMKRKNQFGKTVTITRKGLAPVSIINYMTDIRTVFNDAMDEFNDEDKDEIRILHYPFRKYKIKRPPETQKRNISDEQIKSIRDVEEKKLRLSRTIFARDIFMLSFYLCGINFADLYFVDHFPDAKNMRLEYNRKKTKGRRQDSAFISIKIEPEAVALIEKYRDKTGERAFDFHTRYTDFRNFSANVNKGLKKVAAACKIKEKLSTYYARHSWATIARNKCGISKDDVDLALNHIDQGLKMADIYIEKDWTMIDTANRKVLDLLK